MIPDTLGRQLHDKATKGKPLSEEEISQLNEWYAHQDENEANSLKTLDSKIYPGSIQVQIEDTLAQLSTLTNHIQQTMKENNVLRQDIAMLRQQLANQHQLA